MSSRPGSASDPEAEVARLVELRATRVADMDEYGYTWTVMSDPEGNEFCVAKSRWALAARAPSVSRTAPPPGSASSAGLRDPASIKNSGSRHRWFDAVTGQGGGTRAGNLDTADGLDLGPSARMSACTPGVPPLCNV